MGNGSIAPARAAHNRRHLHDRTRRPDKECPVRRFKILFSFALLTFALLALPAQSWAVPPSVTIYSPADDIFAQDDPNAFASYECVVNNDGAWITDCNGDVADGSLLDTSTTGSHSFRVDATDSDGESDFATASYTVAGPPSVSLLTPSEGEIFTVGEGVLDYDCAADGATYITDCYDDGFDTSTPGDFSVTVTTIDALGQSDSVTHNYTVAGPPSVTVNSPSEGDVYALDSSVTPDYTCDADAATQIDTCEDTGVDTSTPGDYSFTATATDLLGQSASVTVNYTVAAPPSVELTTPGDSAVYKQDEAVTADFSCTADSPATSIDSCVGTVDDGSTVDTSTPGNYDFTVTATDMLGQVADVTYNYTVAAKPTAEIVTPADGAVYLIGQQVTADYSCSSDPVTTPGTCDGDVNDGSLIDTASAGAKTFDVTATDALGQSETTTYSYTVLASADAPSVNFTTPAPDAVYAIDQVVNAGYTCGSDPQTTVASCVGSVADGSPLDTSGAGTRTLSVTVTDGFGQSATYTRNYTVAARPSVSISMPEDGGIYGVGQQIAANYNCQSDPATTLTDCAAPASNDDPFDTDTPGAKSFTVTGTDALGQQTQVTHNYTVAAKPSAAITTPAEGAVYALDQVVNADYSCTIDPVTTLFDCNAPVLDGDPIYTSTPGQQNFSVLVVDDLGQDDYVEHSYTVAAKPTVNITTPPEGAVYTLNQSVNANYSCAADAATTLSTCVGSVTNGSPIDTATTGTKTITVTATDALGQSTTVERNYTVAAEPTVDIATPPEGAVYALNQVVNADFSCDKDAATTLASCVGSVDDGSALDTATAGAKSLTVTATDALGQSTTVTRNYTVAAKPTVDITSPTVGAVYALNQAVNADFSCDVDPATTLASCVGSVDDGSALHTATAGAKSLTVTATDALGQSTTVVRSYTVPAKPTVDLTNPAEGSYFLQGQSASASYSCNADSATTISICAGTVPDGDGFNTSTLGSNSFSVTATDALGQATTLTHNYMVVSNAPRAVLTMAAPTDGAVYALDQVVIADYSCSADAPTSVASCIGDVADGDALDTTTAGAKSLEVAVTDNFGRISTEVFNYTVAAKPTVTLTNPPDGAAYALGQSVTADFSCDADSATTLSSCIGSVADGAAIDTSSAGTKTFTVTATDSLGQVRTVNRNYTVAAPAPPTSEPPPAQPPAELKTLLSGKPKLARSGKTATVHQICAEASCVVTLTIKIGKKKYTVRSRPIRQSTSATLTVVKIELPSKLAKQIKTAKQKRQRVRISAKIAARK
jgi:C4-type Zn-finger protein